MVVEVMPRREPMIDPDKDTAIWWFWLAPIILGLGIAGICTVEAYLVRGDHAPITAYARKGKAEHPILASTILASTFAAMGALAGHFWR